MSNTRYLKQIRNFAIIAHIDHGKSTLADRMLDMTGTVSKRDMKDRVLDTLELEQERGITIKLQTARMIHEYKGDDENFKSDQPYILNLIDTPGHVDFAYEVSRSLASSEAAILLVDATQGIQAQTLTTVYKSFEYDLEIIPVINKIDLPSSELEKVTQQLVDTFGFDPDEIIHTSGKTGFGVDKLLDKIVEKCPAPKINEGIEVIEDEPPTLLIYDSFYHEHKGVVTLVKVNTGSINSTDKLISIATKNAVDPIEIGYMTPNMQPQKQLKSGEVGYIATGLKDIKLLHVGDTLTTAKYAKDDSVLALPGYQSPKSMVYASLYPVEANDFEEFSEALEKLALNDSALTYSKEHSVALGSGFNCGFLGLLHLEITQERLEKEFNINLISTTPTVDYKLWLTTKDMSKVPMLSVSQKNDDDESFNIRSAAEFPDMSLVQKIEEPWVDLDVITPEQYIGGIMELCQNARGIYKKMEYITDNVIEGHKHVTLKYEMPTAEIITTFFDKLKSISQGYASMDYDFKEYRESDIVKVAILVNYQAAEALSFLTHRSKADYRGREMVKKLKDLIPRQQFKVPIQASIGGKVLARETLAAYRKDVTAKLYGGDVTRKRKLLEKQKKGKKRLKMFGSVEIPKEAFLGALKID